MTRRHGARSDTPVSKTRTEIDKLLHAWGCRKIAWMDDFDEGSLTIQFIWTDEEAVQYAAQFSIDLTPPSGLTERQADAEVRGRMRTLLYWLRGAVDAVAAGVILPEQVFLPFLVGADGQTVSDVLLPKLRELPGQTVRALLAGGPS